MDRVHTLLLYANGVPHLKGIIADTILWGILNLDDEWLSSISWPTLWKLDFLFTRRRHRVLSYIYDWIDAFQADSRLNVDLCNINNLIEYRSYQRKINEYPLIIISHSAAGIDLSWLNRTAGWLQDRNGKLLVLIGNEYNLMPQKIEFLQKVEADYVGSQLPIESARWLYAPAKKTQVLEAPHGLNQEVYRPDPTVKRMKDIGFVGDRYPLFIGDQHRNNLIDFFLNNGTDLGLSVDIQLNSKMDRFEWASFLSQAHGTIGTEAGTRFLERTDKTINESTDYVKTHPNASFEEVYERFFAGLSSSVSGKAISSRHFEALGTKTCQILLEGQYNGILEADKHYICLKEDYSNIDDVISRFKDVTFREKIVRQGYEHCISNHTYAHRVSSILDEIEC